MPDLRIDLVPLLLFAILGLSQAAAPLQNNDQPPRTTPLTLAIRLEKFEEAKKQITPELVNKIDQGQYHPLTYAVYTGNNELIELLLKAGANPNVIEHNGKTALYVAANLGNTQAINLLHKHGAKYPKADSIFQPAKVAVMANSPAAFKALFAAYPSIDPDIGWNKASRKKWSSGGAFNYAALKGFNECAFLLLQKNCNLNTAQWTGANPNTSQSDFRGKKPLHITCENPLCPPSLVAALLKAGCAPLEGSPSSHLQCKSPLDYAAASGSLEKVKLLIAQCNIQEKATSRSIKRAVFIASAYHHSDIVHYLLKITDDPLPNPEKWLAKHGNNSDSKSRHNPIREQDLTILMPKTGKHRKTGEISGKVAIISNKEVENSAALLFSAMSEIEGVSLVDRDQITQVVAEATLRSFNDNNTLTFHRKIDLIPAENIILINLKKIKSGSFVELVTINGITGMITSRLALSMKQAHNPEYIKKCALLQIDKISISSDKKKSTLAVSIASIKPEMPTDSTLRIAASANTALPFFISNTSGCTHLTRKQLHHLEIEKSIGIEGSYWKAAWIIDGSITGNKDHQLAITLIATNTIDGTKISNTQKINPDTPQADLKIAWHTLAAQINLNSKPDDKQTKQPLSEAQLLYETSEWLSLGEYHDEAIRYASAARILGCNDKNLLTTLIKSRLKSLPLSIYTACHHIRRNPQSLELAKKFKIAKRTSEYLALANTAIDYIHKQQSRLTADSYGGRSRSSFYNEYVHRTLLELLFFRELMHDTILMEYDKSRLSAIDSKIKQLSESYLNKMKDDDSEISSILGLVNSDKSLFYYLESPKLYRQFLERVQNRVAIITLSYNEHKLASAAHYRTKQLRTLGHPITPWKKILTQYQSWRNLPYKSNMAATSAYIAETPIERQQHQSLALKLAIESSTSGNLFSDSYHLRASHCLTGTEYFTLQNNATMFNRFHNKPCSIQLDVDPISIIGTAELSRLWRLYNWHSYLAQMNDDSWLRNIKLYRESQNSIPETHIICPQEWKLFLKLYLKRKTPNTLVTQMLKKMIDPELIGDNRKNTITSNDYVLMPYAEGSPNLGAFIHHAEVTIIGDEVWVPTSYIEPKQYRPMAHKKKHAIHIINIETKKIRTISFPDKFADTETGNTKLIVGETHVYYRQGNELFAIEIKTLKATLIKLPLPFIETISLLSHNNEICISVSSVSPYERSNAINQVILVNGDAITNTLVSNNRKPAQSPLDTPDTKITRIDFEGDHITLFSNHQLGYINPTKTALATYTPKTKKWKILPENIMEAAIKRNQKKYLNFSLQSRTINNGDLKFYLTYQQAYKAPLPELCLSNSKRHAAVHNEEKYRAFSDVEGHYIKCLKINIPTINAPLFDREINNFRVSQYANYKDNGHSEIIRDHSRSWKIFWSSPNDQLRKKMYSVYPLGTWGDQIIITLRTKRRGLPALWFIPKKSVIEALRNQLLNSPSPITFDNQKAGEFTELKYPHVKITNADNDAEIWKNLGIKNSQGLKINGGDKKSIILTSTGAFKDGFTSLSFHARRWKNKKPFQFRISMMVNSVWKEIHNADKTSLRMSPFRANIKINFPQKIQKIRLRLDCHPKNAVLIDDLILR